MLKRLNYIYSMIIDHGFGDSGGLRPPNPPVMYLYNISLSRGEVSPLEPPSSYFSFSSTFLNDATSSIYIEFIEFIELRIYRVPQFLAFLLFICQIAHAFIQKYSISEKQSINLSVFYKIIALILPYYTLLYL